MIFLYSQFLTLFPASPSPFLSPRYLPVDLWCKIKTLQKQPHPLRPWQRQLEGIIAEHNTFKQEVGLLRQLVEKVTNNDMCNCQEEEFGVDDNDVRSIRKLILHELESQGVR